MNPYNKDVLIIIAAVGTGILLLVAINLSHSTMEANKRHVLVRECIASNERIVKAQTDRILSLQRCEDIK